MTRDKRSGPPRTEKAGAERSTRPPPRRNAGRSGARTRSDSAPERIQKLLSRHGVGSRRQVESWVAEGRIQVNGKTAEAGASVSAADQITLDGKPVILRKEAPARVLAYRKQVGEVVARTDPQRRPTIFKRLPRVQGGRWIAVGRLDINTSGLLLLTTDGELASRLMHPSYEIEREYAVRVLGGLSDEAMKQLREGVLLEDGLAKVVAIRHDRRDEGTSANLWYNIVISEGRNREVRRLIEAVGGQVSRLMRVRYGPITIPSGIPSGRGKELDVDQLKALYQAVDLKVPASALKRAEEPRRR